MRSINISITWLVFKFQYIWRKREMRTCGMDAVHPYCRICSTMILFNTSLWHLISWFKSVKSVPNICITNKHGSHYHSLFNLEKNIIIYISTHQLISTPTCLYAKKKIISLHCIVKTRRIYMSNHQLNNLNALEMVAL